MPTPVYAFLVLLLCCGLGLSEPLAEELPITKNTPIPEFQNRPQDGSTTYDLNAPPQGMFGTITMAEGFEEESGSPGPTKSFPSNRQNNFDPMPRASSSYSPSISTTRPFRCSGAVSPNRSRASTLS